MITNTIARSFRNNPCECEEHDQRVENPGVLGSAVLLGVTGVVGYLVYREFADRPVTTNGKLPTPPGPGPGPGPGPVGPPVEPPKQPPKIYLGVQPCGDDDACFTGDINTFPGDNNSGWVMPEKLPVDVVISLPSSQYEPSFAALAGEGAQLVAGQPGAGRDFVFRVHEYATDQNGTVDEDGYSALVTANWHDVDASHNRPMRVYVLRP